MPKNIVICCDGTGNEIEANLSNVLKLFRVVRKSRNQVVYYNPGVGTISSSDPWSRLKADALGFLGLVTGYGLDANVLDAYRFLVDNYEDGDCIYLFGFSRGAYTIRVLAGFLRLIGLLDRPQINLCAYALTAYKRAAEKNDFEIAWRFERVASTRRVPIKFMGVWDTVSSVIVPRPDRLYIPSLEELPYTRTNSHVEIFRQAIAIDERRRMFRINRWAEPQEYKPNPFDAEGSTPQDIKQVWFAGVHADIGGGYPETESGLAKYSLQWMIDEAAAHGLETSAVSTITLCSVMPALAAAEPMSRRTSKLSFTIRCHPVGCCLRAFPSARNGVIGQVAGRCSDGICRCASRAASTRVRASTSPFLTASPPPPPTIQ